MRMHNLLIRPKNLVRTPVTVRAEVQAGEATIWLYDLIDEWWGVNPADLVKQISELAVDTIHLRINSPGGDVFGARAIISALRGSGANVIAYIDGLAASAATFIAVNCNEVQMSDGAFFMIHQAASGVWGNAQDLRETADLLDKVDGSIVRDYVAKTGQTEQQVIDWMAAETWFTADEAKEAGFVDAVVTGQAVDNRSNWDFSACRNAPAAVTQLSVPDPQSKPITNDCVPSMHDAYAHAVRVLQVIQKG